MEPEGESSPPESETPQRMESVEKKNVEQRLTPPAKSDAIPLSPVSPASSNLRSKRKEGKGIFGFFCSLFILLLMQ